MSLDVGDPAPTVSALTQDGAEVELTFDEPTVLYFYPRDATPGCTTEARQFELEREAYRDAGVAVYGVSTDDVDAHREFHEAEDLTFDLLADPEASIAEAFDVSITDGKTARTTFVLDGGRVAAVYERVNPDGHARTVLMDALEDELVTLPEE